MRILSGIYKGIHIKTSSKQNYRPTQTKVRKSIFDSLRSLSQRSVLDLFSGTGILGFESASRGASSVVFVEKNLFIYRMLKINSTLFPNTNFSINRNDAIQFLENSQSYDLIIADPPYNHFNRNYFHTRSSNYSSFKKFIVIARIIAKYSSSFEVVNQFIFIMLASKFIKAIID